MLRDLHIRNLAVLEQGSIEFGPGFNVLSGETGAGKSIVVDSLALLSGIRANSDLIRTGAETLTVTGVFDLGDADGGKVRRTLAAAGIDASGEELVIRREVSRSGRNRVFLDDQPVTLGLLGAVAPELLRIHGQREELGLVAPELQRTWLDRGGGAEAGKLLAATAAAHERYRELAERLERLVGDDRARRERIDLLRFQVTEIDEAEVAEGEEDELRRERGVLRHSEAIREALAASCELLFDSDGAARESLTPALRHLRGIETWEPAAAAWAEELEEVRIRVDELESALRRRLDEVEADPRRLDALEDRLVVLERLFRKYGASSAEVLEHRRTAAAELAEIDDVEGAQGQLEGQVEEALLAYRKAAQKLSAGRRRWSEKLVRRVTREVREMALDKARFAVRLERRRRADSPLEIGGEAVDFGEQGYDQVIFVFSPNPGEELQPLARAASGGELSRLYLAVQLASRGRDAGAAGASLVFDEVDTGIGGAEAALLGGKLKRLAQGGQILAVTHLPQVASHADLHFKVEKRVTKGRTRTEVKKLTEEARVEEVARMLGGSEITELTVSHARELIAGADV